MLYLKKKKMKKKIDLRPAELYWNFKLTLLELDGKIKKKTKSHTAMLEDADNPHPWIRVGVGRAFYIDGKSHP